MHLTRPENTTGGFSLLEVLVAVAIASLCITVLLRIFALAAGATRIGDEYYRALQIAESRLALTVADGPKVGVARGRSDDDYHWQTNVEAYRPDLSSPLYVHSDESIAESLVPYLCEVAVEFGEGRKRRVALTTVQLGVAE